MFVFNFISINIFNIICYFTVFKKGFFSIIELSKYILLFVYLGKYLSKFYWLSNANRLTFNLYQIFNILDNYIRNRSISGRLFYKYFFFCIFL